MNIYMMQICHSSITAMCTSYAKNIQLHLPALATVPPKLTHVSLPNDGICIGSPVSAGLCVVTNTQTAQYIKLCMGEGCTDAVIQPNYDWLLLLCLTSTGGLQYHGVMC